MKNSTRLILLVVVLFVTTLSCNFPVSNKNPVAGDPPLFLALPESLEEVIENSGQSDLSTGLITVIFSEEELGGYLNTYLASQSDLKITNAYVRLQDRRINIYGKYEQGFITADVIFSLEASVNSSGLSLKIVKADLGPIPAPENLRNTVSTMIEKGLADYFNTGINGVVIEQITISDGLLAIIGRK